MTTLLVCLFDELRYVRLVEEEAFNHYGRAKELYLWGVLQDHRVMEEFLRENFTGHPKLHPQMVVFYLGENGSLGRA